MNETVEELRFLTRAAVGYRYPGEFADYEEAEQALDICIRMRATLLRLFDEPHNASGEQPPDMPHNHESD